MSGTRDVVTSFRLVGAETSVTWANPPGNASARACARWPVRRSAPGCACDGPGADLPDRHPRRGAAGLVAAGGVVERRRDLDPAPPAGCYPARAATGSREADVAGSGVAGAAGREAAGRAPRRLRLIVAPSSILRWHRDTSRAAGRAGPAAATPDGRERAAVSGCWCCGWPARMSPEVTVASTANSRCSASPRPHQRFGRSSRTPA